jgi:anaerobic ribonucleoside-triphosphate reductase
MADINTNTEITLSDEDRQPCEIWSRVMGYHRPITEWNKGKKSEFASRKLYLERPLACCANSMNVAAE